MSNGQEPTNETPLNGNDRRSGRRPKGPRVFRYGGALIVLLSLLGLAGWLYFRSARFSRQVATLLETRLGEFGLRGEIGGFGWTLDPQTVRLRDIHLYNLQTGAPVASIGELTIEAEIINPYALRMERDVVLKTARLSQVELEILVDRHGRSNLTELRLPTGGAKRVSLDLSQLQVTIEESRVRYQDERIGWGVALDGLSVSARSGTGKGPLDLALTAGATGGAFHFEGRSSPIERIDLTGRVGAKGLVVERFGMSAALAKISGAAGEIGWAPFALGFNGEVKAATAELNHLFFPAGLELAGEVVCQCRVEATGAGVFVEGSPTAARLAIEGANLTGIETRAARFELAKGRTQFFAQRARVRSVQIETIELSAVEIRAARGEVVSGQTRILAPEANLAQVTWPGSHLDDLRLSAMRADFPGKGFRVAAQAALTAGEIAGLPFEEVETKARLDPAKLVLEELTARIDQGEVEAGATIPLRRGLPFVVAGRFQEIPSREIFGLLDLEALPVSGAVDGEGELTWIGAKPETLTGRIAAQFAGTTTPLAGELPLAGPIQVEVEEGRFRFEKFDLRTEATRLGASGTLALRGESDLALTLASDRPEELLAVARTLAPLAPLIEEYRPFLQGHAGFTGQLNGDFRAPILRGNLTVEEVGLRAAELGAIAGGIVLTGDALRVTEGRLGSASRFELDLPFDQAAHSGRLSATIAEIEITQVLQALDWQALDRTGMSKEVEGQLTGTLALTGLPGKIQGTVSLGLERAIILRQAAQRAVAEIRFVDHVARLSSLAIRLPQTNFESDGFWNLASGAYELKGQASQISLSALAEALDFKQLRIEGEGETRFVVSGRLTPEAPEGVERDPFSLTLIANTSQLKINQRPVVDYRVYAGTSAQGVMRIAINTLSGPAPRREEELLLMTAALRDPAQPVAIRGEVSKMEIAPLLAILAPDQDWIRDGTLSGRISIQGPTRTAQGERTIERLAGDLVLEEMQMVVAENQLRLASPVSVRVEGGKMVVPPARLLGQGVELVVRGTTGIASERPLDLSLRASLNLADLSGIESLLSLQGVQGRVQIEAQAGGTIQTPNITGAIDLQNLGFSLPDLPIFLTNGNGLLTLAGETLRIESFRATANEGRLEARGELQLDRFQPRQWQLRFKVEGAEVHDRDLSASLSTELSLTGTPEGQTLTGSINTTRLEYDARIDLDSLLASGAAGGSRGGGAGLEFDLPVTTLRGRQSVTGRSSLPPTRINIRLEARDAVAVRSEQINALGSALLTVTGTTQDPSLTGRLESESGFVRFRGQRYEITRATLDLLPGTTGANLTLVAESEFRGYRVLLGLNGQIDALETTLRSEPPLSRDEILALITTGRAEAGPLTSQDPLRSGVGAAASLLTSGLISRPTEQLLGLSRFQIDPIIRPNTNPAARLTVGQQLSRNLYVSYSTNL
ncbi:MAG: translocation/assembly module TamB domain-containing protein, partial [Blastocatellia bacterium]